MYYLGNFDGYFSWAGYLVAHSRWIKIVLVKNEVEDLHTTSSNYSSEGQK
jgi:hypothetical protein